MRAVFVHRDHTMVGLRKSMLEEAGIACFIRNEHTSASLGAGFFGMVQSPLFDPVLCIVDDDRFADALEMIRAAGSANPAEDEDWTCPVCQENIPGSFEVCWNCPESDLAS